MKKSVFVTGAHDGTGFAIARRFAGEGYDVFIGSRDREKADAAAAKLPISTQSRLDSLPRAARSSLLQLGKMKS